MDSAALAAGISCYGVGRPLVTGARLIAVDRHALEASIAALEAQRAVLGNALVDAALEPLRAQLDAASDAVPGRATRSSRELTHASILFADVAGSTALAQRLDDEDFAAALTAVLDTFRIAIGAQRGRLLRVTGDGVKAIFGADGDPEDGEARAVRAGLAIVEASRRDAAELQARHGLSGLGVRVGIATGSVAVGGGIEDDHSAIGATVHLAARLEQSAPNGSVHICAATHRRVRARFEALEQPTLELRGIDRPQRSWLITRERPRDQAPAALRGSAVRAPTIGRDAERAAILAAAGSAGRDRRLVSVAVFAEAGMGKTRMLEDLVGEARASRSAPTLIAARAWPDDRFGSYAIVRRLLVAAALGDADASDAVSEADDTPNDSGVLERMRQMLAGEADAERDLESLGRVLGLGAAASAADPELTPRQARERAIRVSASFLAAAARARPVWLLLDDLHWADDGSLEWLRSWQAMLAGAAVAVIALTRPEIVARRGRGEAGPPAFDDGAWQRVDLLPLAPVAATALLDRELEAASIPAEWHRRLLERAGGNPLFIEELSWAIAEARARAASDDDDDEFPPGLPSTLAGLLQSRLGSLSPGHRATLRNAAVVGPVFWDTAVEAIEADASRPLDSLVERGLLIDHLESAFGRTRERAFSHQLLQEAAYATLLKRPRREAHGRVGDWMAARAAQRSFELFGTIARHYELAERTDEAAEFFARAAEQARQRYDNEAALALADRALSLLGDGGDARLRWRLHGVRLSVFDVLGRADDQARELDARDALLDSGRLGDDTAALRAEAWLGRAFSHDRRGEGDAAMAAARRAGEFAEQAGLWRVAAQAHGQVAFTLSQRDDFAPARAAVERGIELARRQDDPLAQAQLLAIAANVEGRQGRIDRQVVWLEEAIGRAETIGHRRLRGVLSGNLGLAFISLGDAASARRCFLESLAIARAIGNRIVESSAHCDLAMERLLVGDFEQVIGEASAALAAARASAARLHAAEAGLVLGQGLAATRRLDEALAAWAEAAEEFEAVGMAVSQRHALLEMALAECRLGRAAAGREGLAAVMAASGDATDLMPGADDARKIGLAVLCLREADDGRAEPLMRRAFEAVERTALGFENAALAAQYRAAGPAFRFLRAIAERHSLDPWSYTAEHPGLHGGR